MADTTLDLLNQTQIELLQKYDSALNRFNEINNYFEDGKAIEAINALKLDGFEASQNPSSDQIPVLNTSGQLQLPFNQIPILIGNQDLMSRTFYVDAINGDDTNDGSSEAPFETLQAAVDSVPVGGYGEIILVSDFTGIFSANLKTLRIYMKSGVTWTIPMGSRCNISGSSVIIFNYGHIIVSRGDGSSITGNDYAGFWVNNHEKDSFLAAPTSLYVINYRATENIITIEEDRALFGSRTYGFNQNIQMNFGIYNLYCNGDIVSDGYILRLNHGVSSFQWNNLDNTSLRLINSAGDTLTIQSRVAGIIKDANGVPRNIISNIVF